MCSAFLLRIVMRRCLMRFPDLPIRFLPVAARRATCGAVLSGSDGLKPIMRFYIHSKAILDVATFLIVASFRKWLIRRTTWSTLPRCRIAKR